MPRPAQPLEERHAERRTRLTQRLTGIVERLLDGSTGFADLHIEVLIREARIARSTFYRYYDDKSDLLDALSATAIRHVADAAEALWALPPGASRDDLARATQGAVDAFSGHLGLLAAVADAAATDERAHARMQESFGAARRAAAAHITAGQQQGFVRSDLDPDTVAGWLTWMTERGMHQLFAGADPDERRVVVRSLVDIIWYTLYADQGRSS
ncbi:MAG: TetR/AcrR family transcriptional regulator [Solirubrobacteraceae bacterium]